MLNNLLLAVLASTALCGCSIKTEKSTDGQSDPHPASDLVELEEVPDTSANWVVHTELDNLTGKRYKAAYTRSRNTIRQRRPYKETNLVIQYVKHPRFGEQMIFEAQSGQMVCRSFGCEGSISFDGKVERLSLARSEDGSSLYLFAKYPKAILRKMNKAKRTVVQITFYRHGAPSFVFEPEPINWDLVKL